MAGQPSSTDPSPRNGMYLSTTARLLSLALTLLLLPVVLADLGGVGSTGWRVSVLEAIGVGDDVEQFLCTIVFPNVACCITLCATCAFELKPRGYRLDASGICKLLWK